MSEPLKGLIELGWFGEMPSAEEDVQHGVSCDKKPHDRPGQLHGADDDSAFDVDGVSYCGRCHTVLDIKAEQPVPKKQKKASARIS